MTASGRVSRLVHALANKQLFWLLLIALVVVLSFWWIPGDSTSNADTYSSEAEGKLAFYSSIRELHGTVRRSVDTLVPPTADTLVILNPARIPETAEWQQLYDFVNRGGSLVFVAATRSPNFSTGQFPVSLKSSASPDDIAVQLGNLGQDPFEPVPARTSFESRLISWASAADFEVTDRFPTEVLVRTQSGIQAVRCHVGLGTAVFVASDIPFQNRSLIEDDTTLLTYRLFEAAYPSGEICFDESLNSSGTPRVLGILFTPRFRPLSLQLLLVTVLFGWWGSRRFGPAVLEKSSHRRAIVEHAQALGNMHFKVGSACHALRTYFEYFRTTAQVPPGRLEKVAQTLAARSGVEQTEIERLLTETQNAIQNTNVSAGVVATLIQQLAALRDRMARYGRQA